MEEWRDIPGYEGCYQVSSAGRVRSLDRDVPYPAFTTAFGVQVRAHTRHFKGKILKPGRACSGHVSVVLGRKAGSKGVHTLVMLAFVGVCPENHEVLHKNHKPADNRRSNLKYGTRSENIKMDWTKGGSRIHPVVGTPLDGGPKIYFFTQAAANRKFSKNGRGQGSIWANLSGRTRYAYGHTWVYA